MLLDTPLPLIVNTFVLALALAFLLIVLWYDTRRQSNQFFALFLVLMALWNIGFLAGELISSISPDSTIARTTFAASQSGYMGASVALYALLTVIIGVQPRRFRLLITLYLAIGLGYTWIVILTPEFILDSPANQSFILFFAVIFNTLIAYVSWRYRRKLRSFWLTAGILLFVLGQTIQFFNPELGIVPFSTTFSSIGAMIISFAIIQREILLPLLERGTQLESMHEVSVAITSRIGTDAVLTEIAERAAFWLEADASGIFLRRGQQLELVALHNLPDIWLGSMISFGQGIVGVVAQTNQSIYLESYSRDWNGDPDLPMAADTFGSTIAVPLVYNEAVMGTLLVVAGLHGRLLDRDDARLLELLAAQAAVAISHGELFNNQKRLTDELQAAHGQLRTVLVSTENPVVAVDRQLRIIFANPAAEKMLALDSKQAGQPIIHLVPGDILPKSFRHVLRDIQRQRVHIYEVEIMQNTYLCHIASLGEGRIEGWVAVLNDVTELKELDRIKSEMVRMTSHDLKNPLQAAMANLELLRDDLTGIDNTEIDLSINNIEKQLLRMIRIIGGILDLERVRMGAKPTQICEIQSIIVSAMNELTDIAADANIHLETHIEPNLPSFLGDKEQFTRAIVNLVENGIKFNRPDGAVRVVASRQDNRIAITVSDDGIGIPQEAQARIFDRFYRAHQAGAEHISGSGLGLSLVKTVVDSHAGRIWIESELQVGTTFHIELPILEEVSSVDL